MEDTQDLSLEDEPQQEQSVDTAQVQQQEYTEPQTQTQQPVQQQDFPETLKKFQKEDGSIDYDKLQKSYVEAEKQLGRKNQEVGDLRKTLLQSQVQTPQYNQQPSQLQSYARGTREGDYSQFVAPDGMLTESDFRAIDAYLSTRDRQFQTVQQQQQQQMAYKRWNAIDQYTDHLIKDMEVDAFQENEMKRLLSNNHKGYLTKIYTFAQTGQGLNETEIDNMVRDLGEAAQNNVKQSLAKKYGFDPATATQINNAMKQQAAQAVTSPMGGSNGNANEPAWLKGTTASYRKALKDYGLLD